MKKITLLAITTFISGCASLSVQPEKNATTHGYVYVNFPKYGSGQSLTLKSLKDNSIYTLIQRNDPKNTSYGQWLPNGEYKIVNFGNSIWGDYESVFVKQGKITDMGNLFPFQLGHDEFIMLPIHEDIHRTVFSALKEYNPLLTINDIIKWSPSTVPKPMKTQYQTTGLGPIVDSLLAYERQVNKISSKKKLRDSTSLDDFLKLAKKVVPPLNQYVKSDKELNLYFGADLGQIKVRKADGEWNSIDTGSHNSVTALEVTGTAFYAGFENGSVRESNDNGLSWKNIATFDDNEAVVDIDKINDNLFFITRKIQKNKIGVNINYEINIYSAKIKNLNSIKLIKSHINGLQFPNTHGEVDSNYYYINLYPRLERIDINSLSLKDISPHKRVTGFHKSNESNIISTFNAEGAFSKLFISTNNGESWQKYDSPPYLIQDVYFKNIDKGQSVKWSMSAFSGKLEYMQYIPKTNSWKKIYEAPHGCIYALQDSNKDYKFCVASRGDILSYNNSKWSIESSID